MIRKLAVFLFAIFLVLSTYLYSQERQHEVVYQKKRIALVIGNAAYKSAPLRNPTNDANDMAAVLKRFGFDVTLIINASQKTMEMAIRDFGNKIKRGGIGLFYYAGHGMQIKGSNYLIPIGTNIQAEDEIGYEAVNMGRVLSKMESAGNDMNMIILDACRDNPFARSFRSSSRGLARMDAPKGTLIVYSTSPGKTAADGTGRNGIFTEHFLNIIKETNLEITHLLKEVRRRVSDETNGIQVPWESSSLIGNFYFSTIRSEPPETSSIDISSIKKAAEERERIKSQWQNWQIRMKSDFMEVEKLDKSTAYTNQEKETTWRQFLDNYKADNPYSSEDEQLRQKAQLRLRQGEEQRLKVIPPPKKSGPIITPEGVKRVLYDGVVTKQVRDDFEFQILRHLYFPAGDYLHNVFLFKVSNLKVPVSYVFLQFYKLRDNETVELVREVYTPTNILKGMDSYGPNKGDFYSIACPLIPGNYIMGMALASQNLEKIGTQYFEFSTPTKNSVTYSLETSPIFFVKKIENLDTPEREPLAHKGFFTYSILKVEPDIEKVFSSGEYLEILFYVFGAQADKNGKFHFEVNYEVLEGKYPVIHYAPGTYDTPLINQPLPLERTIIVKSGQTERTEKRGVEPGKYILSIKITDKNSGKSVNKQIDFQVK